MPILGKLQEFLDLSGVAYTHTVHPLAYTAREVACAEHVPPQEVAKVVVVIAGGEYKMLVLPASKVVDFQEVRDAVPALKAICATPWAAIRRGSPPRPNWRASPPIAISAPCRPSATSTT